MPPIIHNAEVIVHVGETEVGDFDDTRRTDAANARRTMTLPLPEASGHELRAETAILAAERAILAETAIPVVMTTVQ